MSDEIVHTCHWTGCGKAVPPSMWGCREHWFKLPKLLRAKVWRHYRAGQEVDKRPSPEYLATVREIKAWIADQPREERDDE